MRKDVYPNQGEKKDVFVSVVIPVYNGELTIQALFEQLLLFFTQKFQQSFEVIFVHDQGPDNSWKVIRELQNKYPQYIKAVQLTRNFGQHNALICGFKYASGDWIVTMDEDLQHLPSDIQLLFKKQKEKDADIVYGKFQELKHHFFRNFTSHLMKRILALAIPELHKDYSAFRLIRVDIARYCTQMNNSYTFLDGYLSWITTQVDSVEVQHQERVAGKSSYTLRKLVNHSINILITFSNFPVRFCSISSIIIFILSVIYSAYIFFRKVFFNDLIPGYSSMAIILGFGIGVVLLGIGILGEYIYQINQKTTRRPNYLEGKIIDKK